ncbi:hypothetical protein BKA65DRAFT_219435 [Rhexocercosporidium sp. MPI-PUGE-AT-0058]|nr:hypothetical protein BKA65DRAFT_219435 [Rhexocercosporidium sp. MPI-PUGE-AT-0058]
MELFNSQLHQQHTGRSPNALANPLCESPRLGFPPVPQTRVDLSPSTPQSRIYHHPYVKVFEDSSSDDDLPPPPPRSSRKQAISKDLHSDDDDLPPPRPRDPRNKAASKVTPASVTRSSSPPRKITKLNIPRHVDVNNLQALIADQGIAGTPPHPGSTAPTGDESTRLPELPTDLLIAAWKFLQLWAVPDDMYWPWDYAGEGQAWQIVHNAEANAIWNARKSPCVYPGVGNEGLFSVYNGVVLKRAVEQSQQAVEQSRAAAMIDSNYEGAQTDVKMWSIGCDFTIFSRSERIGRQNTPIVPFNLHGTSSAITSFIESEVLMRKLAHLELISAFEVPDLIAGQELAKIAFAFFKGHEIPENVEFLPTCPDARPKDFYIDHDGGSDRSKVVRARPLADPVLAIFLQDVLISNYLEQVFNNQKQTMSGSMRVHRHSTILEVKEKLKAFELKVIELKMGNPALYQPSWNIKKRQGKRRRDWWATYSSVIMTSILVAAIATSMTRRQLGGIRKDCSIELSPVEDDTTTEAGDLAKDALPEKSTDEIYKGSGTSRQATDTEDIPEQTDNEQAIKPENISVQTVNTTKSNVSKGKAAAGSAGDDSPDGESSSILPSSVSDVMVVNSSEPEITAEATSIVVSRLAESTIVVLAPASDNASTTVQQTAAELAAWILGPPLPGGKSKKKNKSKKGANAQAFKGTGSSTLDQSFEKPNDAQAPKDTKSSGKSVQEVTLAASHEDSAANPGAVLGFDTLGISLPMDGDDDSWEKVKSRSTQKTKVTMPSAKPAVKGGFKGPSTASRVGVNQPQRQQGSRVVKSGQPPKIAPAKSAPSQPRDARVFDPNEYPAMPAPPAYKIKTQVNDTSNATLSQTSPSSALVATAERIPVIPAVTKASSIVIPEPETLVTDIAPEVDSDPEDLYGASPPRKTRAVADAKEQVVSTAKPAESIEDNSDASGPVSGHQAGNKPAAANSTAQTIKSKKTPGADPINGPKIEKKPESTTPACKDKNTLALDRKDAADPQLDNKQALSNSSAPVVNAKNAEKPRATNAKIDTKTSTLNKTKGSDHASGSADNKAKVATPAIVGSHESKCKGKPTADPMSNNPATAGPILNESKVKGKASVAKSNTVALTAAVPTSNHSKGKGKASTSDTKVDGSKSTTESNVGQTSASNPGADGPTKSKRSRKTTHKHTSKSKGSGSGAAPAEMSTNPMPPESKKPAATNNVLASTSEVSVVPSIDTILQSIPAAKTPVEDVVPTAAAVIKAANEKDVKSAATLSEPLVTPEHVQLIPVSPATQPLGVDEKSNVKKQVEGPVPDDLVWADLVSPTKPGHLKRRLSVDNAKPDDDDLESPEPKPVRRSSISASNLSPVGRLQFGELPMLVVSSSAAGDDPFVSGGAGPDVSFTSSSTDGEVEQRDSRTSPEAHITPGTELMLTPASPDSYNGEPYINVHGHEVTLFRRDAEISNFPGQKHHQRAHSGPGYGNRFITPVSNPIQGHSGHASGQQYEGLSGYGGPNYFNFNSGQGYHSHPQPAFYGAPQNTGYVVHQGHGNQGSSSSASLGGDLKGKGPEMGMQGGMGNHGLSPIPEASISSEAETEEADGHNPPTKCTFCEQSKVPTAANPCFFCPLCGVAPDAPRYCSRSCLLSNAWEHTHACRNVPAYISFTNTNLGPTYHYETFPLNNCHYMPDSPEKYRQKMFATFCKYGQAPDIRHAHSKKWPNVDWGRILPSRSQARAGDYHIFKSQATHTGPNLSKAHVICTIKFPVYGENGLKFMITRAMNVAFVTHDLNVINFLCRLLRSILMNPRQFQSFGAVEPQEIVMMEFKSQFYKEFGVTYNDAEPLINPDAGWKTVEQAIMGYEANNGVLQYWLNAVANLA